MMNYFLASRGEMTQRNGSTRTPDYYSQILNNRQSLGAHMRAPQPQATLQRPPNHVDANNFIQGSQKNNIIGDAKTQSIVPFNSFSKDTASLITAARYGRTLPLTPPSGPRQQIMSSRNTSLSPLSHIGSVQNSSSNGVCLQAGYGSGFLNPSKTTFPNQKNLPCLPYGENSYCKNNSSVLNGSNPHHPRVVRDNFHDVKEIAGLRLLSLHPVRNQDLNLLRSSGKDLSRDKGAMKRPLCEIPETDITQSASKRPRMSSTPPDYYEGMQPQMKRLFLYKDNVKNINSVSTANIITGSKENHEEDLDLSLHL